MRGLDIPIERLLLLPPPPPAFQLNLLSACRLPVRAVVARSIASRRPRRMTDDSVIRGGRGRGRDGDGGGRGSERVTYEGRVVARRWWRQAIRCDVILPCICGRPYQLIMLTFIII